MKNSRALRKIFNALAASAAAFTLLGAPAKAETPPEPVAACAEFPEFQKPVTPMPRQSRLVESDPDIEAQQKLLIDAGFDIRSADGRIGSATRAAMREFLLFYGPLFGSTDYARDLSADDAAQLEKYATQIKEDAKNLGLSKSAAGALRLSSLRTGVAFDDLVLIAKEDKGEIDGVSMSGSGAGDLFKFDHATWLYLVKTHGADYGLSFYADQIELKTTKNGKTLPLIDNPFVERQALALKENKRLSALLAAEYIKNKATLPPLSPPVTLAYTAQTKRQQEALLTLGFDIGDSAADGLRGTMTDIALREFQLLYGTGKNGVLSAKEEKFLFEAAARAKKEAAAFAVPVDSVGAIRMASTEKKQSFGYMMELAAAESSFVHEARARTSSATGLYQFIESTWLDMIKRKGAEVGLGVFAPEIELYRDAYDRPQARLQNSLLRKAVLDLRRDPHLSALMSAEFQLENKGKQSCYVTGDITRTDMYLAHFLGPHDSVVFINAKKAAPNQSAVALFTDAAEYNVNVFYEGHRVREKTLGEVYNFFGKKFDRGVYDAAPAAVTAEDFAPQKTAPQKQKSKKKKKPKPQR